VTPDASPTTDASTGPVFSVVVPMFNEAAGILLLHGRLTAVMDGIGEPWEVVLVNDGSRDATLATVEALRDRDPRVAVAVCDASDPSRYYAIRGRVVKVTTDINHVGGALLDPTGGAWSAGLVRSRLVSTPEDAPPAGEEGLEIAGARREGGAFRGCHGRDVSTPDPRAAWIGYKEPPMDDERLELVKVDATGTAHPVGKKASQRMRARSLSPKVWDDSRKVFHARGRDVEADMRAVSAG